MGIIKAENVTFEYIRRDEEGNVEGITTAVDKVSLDVGQGDAAVVSTYDGRAFLVDGGGVYGKERGENKGATVVLPYLESLGIREVTAAFVSHPDSDHMTGILEVMDEMPVQAVCLSAYPFAEEEWERDRKSTRLNSSHRCNRQ